ncbi:DNA invertase Pin-like site-specific DNA recombinase [Massilia aurea]|uniref:DNA invertase Pin-like site-specific DNA recombinase n=1 Tax=Massilia aurea TaxID=373040 RepID=A0A7W9X3T3_9BURK|nr:recombinase family protein [Massilia aurea]MBB6135984.1 DNA invertase Pin-like site-specific DNA recombinase [Massilia aurea]
MFVRAYLRASTNQQDASRAKEQLKAFAAERNLTVAAWYVENESGASLQRPALLDLIADAEKGDILLLEQVDRLSRLDEKDWDTLKTTLKEKEIRVVAQDLPTSWMMAVSDPTTARMFASINDMMLDMLAAIARKDYEDRRRRAAQGIEKAKAKGAYKGRKEDTDRNALIQRHLKAGQSSWKEIMELVGCSRGTVAKQAELLKASQAAA